jgi:type I restriction enzyme, S subunit
MENTVMNKHAFIAYLDGLQAKVNALWKLQAESGEGFSALMPSILDKAFKGEL